jgi:hypothetical protein
VVVNDVVIQLFRYGLSIIVLGLIIVPSVVAVLMVLEAMARADILSKKFPNFRAAEYEPISPDLLDDDADDAECSPQKSSDAPHLVRSKKFELVEVSKSLHILFAVYY